MRKRYALFQAFTRHVLVFALFEAQAERPYVSRLFLTMHWNGWSNVTLERRLEVAYRLLRDFSTCWSVNLRWNCSQDQEIVPMQWLQCGNDRSTRRLDIRFAKAQERVYTICWTRPFLTCIIETVRVLELCRHCVCGEHAYCKGEFEGECAWRVRGKYYKEYACQFMPLFRSHKQFISFIQRKPIML